jgi:hypothetical protein
MAHYAKVLDGKVTNVIVAEADFLQTFVDNTPGEWTVCRGSFPYMFTTFCCGHFSGIGGDCVTTTFTNAATGTGYTNASGACCHCGVYQHRFVIGKMTGSANTFAYCISNPMCPSCGCGFYCNLLRGTQLGSSTVSMANPFCCSTYLFLYCTNFSSCHPTISFMTCTYANTNNIRAWIYQLHDYSSGPGCCGIVGGSPIVCTYTPICMGASCTLVEWNCGTPRGCTITGYTGPLAIGSMIPIANTILIVGNPSQCSDCYDDVTTGYRCGIFLPFAYCFLSAYCNNFTWGSSHCSSPDGYGSVEPSCTYSTTFAQVYNYNTATMQTTATTAIPQNYTPNLGYITTCFCCFDYTSTGNCSPSFMGHIVQINPNNNNFVARISFSNCQAAECHTPSWLYNYPTDGSNANTTYGRWDCSRQTQLSCSNYCYINPSNGKLFCNILLAHLQHDHAWQTRI